MATSAINPIIDRMNAPASSSTGAAKGKSQLDKEDFMKLLTSQLRYQNPLDPVTNSDFTSQLSQYSTVDAINALNKNFADFMMLQNLTQGAQMIGKRVSYTTGGGVEQQGVVESVQNASGKVNLIVNGLPVELGNIKGILANR